LSASNQCKGEAFVTKFSADRSTVIYSTYLGGSGRDEGNAIAVDSSNNAYVTGSTLSTDFPIRGGWQSENGGKSDAFVTKLSVDVSALVYSTYLGGSRDDVANAISVNAEAVAVVAGRTNSPDFDLNDPIQLDCQKDSNGVCTQDGFVAV